MHENGGAAMKEDEQQRISRLVDAYFRSVISLDLDLASSVWLTSADVSFIHPRGHERGWDQIRRNFYEATMGTLFSERTLKAVTPVKVRQFGSDAALVEFDWDFVAKRVDNGELLHTTGRESQVFAKVPDLGWRLVHVHYSGPAITGTGQGF
jgi:ketosteroid isomerase-like protein